MTQRLKWAFLFAMVIAVSACAPTVPKTAPTHTTRASFAPGCAQQVSPKQLCYTPPAPPTAFPSPGPGSRLTSIAFSDAQHGWAVGVSCAGSCAVEFSATADGGNTWSVLQTVGVVTPLSATPVAPAVRFVGQNGWIFGPGIFETHDGGTTWRHTVQSTVLALEPDAGTVWAIVCATPPPTCHGLMLASQPGSDSWIPAPVQPPIADGTQLEGTAPQALERAAGGATFLSTVTADGGQGLDVTRDLGRSWSALSVPCSRIVSIRSLDSHRVWILCATPCCTGNWLKSVYVSSDGGVSWQQQSEAGKTMIGSIPFTGSAEALIVTSQTTALFGASGPAGVWRTSDSGVTWSPVFTDDCVQGGDPVSEVWFVDASHGWAVTAGGGQPGCPPLLRTTDGGVVWVPIASPFPASLH